MYVEIRLLFMGIIRKKQSEKEDLNRQQSTLRWLGLSAGEEKKKSVKSGKKIHIDKDNGKGGNS